MIICHCAAVTDSDIHQLIRDGAKLISAPSEATGGGWVAVCDEAEQLHRL